METVLNWNTLQADTLKLVAKKLQSSLAVEGELPEDGLAAFGDDGDDMMLALARQIVSGEETDADGESVEPVMVNTNDSGHHNESAEGQQSLFSWAEFLAEEPAQPQGRNGKPKPASTSLFEWALGNEREREAEPVGAGR